MQLKDNLKEWTDVDYALFYLAVALGIYPEDTKFLDVKGHFWSAGKTGDAIMPLLISLTEEGYVEYRDEPDMQYRWKQDPQEPQEVQDHQKTEVPFVQLSPTSGLLDLILKSRSL